MFNKVFIRTRPGDDTTITDSMVIDVGDVFQQFNIKRIKRADEIDENTLVLALGGDGTMLSAIRLAADNNAYVTGFNYGRLGYLVPSSVTTHKQLMQELATIIQVVNNYCTGSYIDYEYSLPLAVLTATNNNNDQIIVGAVNDLYFIPAANGIAIDFKISIDNEQSFFETRSSGVVISTPIGSTGLALSAGGSILSPGSKVFEIVSMLPHTLTSRPLIVPDTSIITVSWDRVVTGYSDGQVIDIFNGGSVCITKQDKNIRFIQPTEWNFYDNLKNKMKWNM